jgi:hypothetical protein
MQKPKFIETDRAEFIQNTLPAHEVHASKQCGRFAEIAAFRTGDILVEQWSENCNFEEMIRDENVSFCDSHHEDI